MEKDRNIQLVTILGASVIGAGIGMLLASEMGAITRRRLKEGVNNSIGKLKYTLEVAVENFREKLNPEKLNIEGTYDDLQPNMTYKSEDSILFL